MTENLEELDVPEESTADFKKDLWRTMMPERIFVAVMMPLLAIATAVVMFFLILGLVQSQWNLVIGMAVVETFLVFFYFFGFQKIKLMVDIIRLYCEDEDAKDIDLLNNLRVSQGLPPLEEEPDDSEDKTEQL